jgi:hypothetical protein
MNTTSSSAFASYPTAASDRMSEAWPEAPLDPLGRPAMSGVPPTTGWAQATQTIRRPKGRHSGPCHGDVIPRWSAAIA